ncbi:hypothetical protein [Arthrobacter sp.]|uniref:hypothetical protein n=1 Tax=Arthrobacter sp. TaxID=1667 RepID=UPI003A91B3BA
MNKISFTDIDVSADGWIRCNVQRSSAEELRIQLPHSFVPGPDLIAAAFSALCGDKFDSVHMDLPIGPEQHGLLESELEPSSRIAKVRIVAELGS